MRSLKLAGVVACGLALSVTTATAAPQVLDDAALDGVVAGVEFSFPGRISESGFGIDRPTVGPVFGVLVPDVVPEIIIPMDRQTNTQSNSATIDANGPVTIGGLNSTSETDPQIAQDWLENRPPTLFFPRFSFPNL